MKTKTPDVKPGDLFLLFDRLPYDYEEDLPISLGPGVCLDNTPLSLLDLAEKGLADYLLPGYSLPGTTINHCCLRCFSEPTLGILPSNNLLFLALLCLRLHCPLPIEIRGQFRQGEDKDPIQEPSLHLLSSPWHVETSQVYSLSNLETSAAIMKRMIAVQQLEFSRLIAGLIFFGQVTLGLSQSFQLSYLGLFAALEALFVPLNKKGIALAKRASNFLGCFDFPVPINEWLKDQYISVRNKLAHGVHDATLGSKLSPERKLSIGRLHEITRLVLLGFLSMDDESLNKLNNLSGQQLQVYLDNLNPATGDFITGQKCWSN